MEDKCADREDLSNMHSLLQNIKANSEVAPETPALKAYKLPSLIVRCFQDPSAQHCAFMPSNVTRAVDVTRVNQTRTDILQMSSYSRSTELHVLHPTSRLKIMEDNAGTRNNKKSHLYRPAKCSALC